jgi:hypothetical protein
MMQAFAKINAMLRSRSERAASDATQAGAAKNSPTYELSSSQLRYVAGGDGSDQLPKGSW